MTTEFYQFFSWNLQYKVVLAEFILIEDVLMMKLYFYLTVDRKI